MTLGRILSHARPYRGTLALIAVLMVFQTGTMLILPWLGGQFAAGLFATAALDLDLVLLGVVVLFGLRAALTFAISWQLAQTSARIVTDLRQQLFERVQALPLRFFRNRRQGDILSSVVFEPEALSTFLTGTLPGLLPNAIAVVGSLVLMATIDPVLALAVVLLIPLFYIALRLIGRRLRPLTVQTREAYAHLVATVDENLSMMPAIKAFLREPERAALHLDGARRLQMLQVAQARSSAFLDAVVRFMAVVAMVIILRLLGDRVTGGEMELAEFVTFLLYVVVLTAPFSSLAGVWAEVQIARGAMKRLEALIGEPTEMSTSGVTMPPITGRITFEDVHLAYPGRGAALAGVSLEIAAGSTVALIGPNGAGKSTLVNLLMRLDRPDSGRVLIDGTDIADVDLESLRSQIAVLSQTVLLFDTTIRDNIAFGRRGATDAMIEEAAERAQARSFIEALPDGYDTLIGERGVRLSGGQAQRLALARALLKNPAVLILDEPTAMFDPEGEDAFIADARSAFADRTVIIITHRPGSLALADRVVAIADGRIAADDGRPLKAARPNEEGDP